MLKPEQIAEFKAIAARFRRTAEHIEAAIARYEERQRQRLTDREKLKEETRSGSDRAN